MTIIAIYMLYAFVTVLNINHTITTLVFRDMYGKLGELG